VPLLGVAPMSRHRCKLCGRFVLVSFRPEHLRLAHEILCLDSALIRFFENATN
jgi:hypothetical protein